MREFAKRIITGNLGKVVEEEDKIICYVKKFTKQNGSYVIACHGINDKNKDLADKYNLNKPICYVIDNFKTKYNNVYIYGYDNCNIVIKNSSFDFGFDMQVNGNCMLDNVSIKGIGFSNLSANEMCLKNVNIKSCFSKVNVLLESSSKINIINSVVGDRDIALSIDSKEEVKIVASKLCGKTVECKTPNMVSDAKSLVNAGLSLEIETDNFGKINIMSPLVIYNKNVFIPKEENVVLEKINNPLKLNRLQLIEALKEIRKECENNIYSQSISKVLKK